MPAAGSSTGDGGTRCGRPSGGRSGEVITLEDVRSAAGRLNRCRTPHSGVASQALDERAGAIVLLKAEPFQPAVAFEFRGAVLSYNRCTEDREARDAQLAVERGLVPVPAYDDPLVMAGQDTTRAPRTIAPASRSRPPAAGSA